ncbi:MAG: hypothetical protein ABFD52_09325 [Acidobacteriota bacterium]
MLITKLINDRRRDDVLVREADSTPIVTLGPGGRDEVATEDPYAVLAPFSEVRFLDEAPYANCTPRPDFQPPHRKRPCLFLLTKGRGWVERLGPLTLMRGVPVTVDLSLDDQYIMFNRVELGVPVMKRFASEQHDGLVMVRWDFEERCSSRPIEELEAIQRELEALEAKATLERAAVSALNRATDE